MTLALAQDLHGACPRCPQPSWHNGDPCPLWPAATERERAVPCARCRRSTYRNDGFCDRCARTSAGVRDGGDRSAAVTPSSSPAGASRMASQSTPVGDLRT